MVAVKDICSFLCVVMFAMIATSQISQAAPQPEDLYELGDLDLDLSKIDVAAVDEHGHILVRRSAEPGDLSQLFGSSGGKHGGRRGGKGGGKSRGGHKGGSSNIWSSKFGF